MIFNGMSVAKKIYTILFLGLIAVLAIMIISFKFFDDSNSEFDSLSKHDMKLMSTTLDMKYNIAQVQQWLTDISATRGAEGFDDGFGEAENYSKEVAKNISSLKSYKSFMNSSEYSSIVSSIESNFANFYRVGKQMANIYIKEGPDGGNKFMGTFDEQAEAMQNSLQKLEKLATTRLNSRVGIHFEHISLAETLLIVVGISMFVLLLAVSLFIINSINSSLVNSIDTLVENNTQIKSSANALSDSATHLLGIATSQTDSTEQIIGILEKSKDNLHSNISHSNEANNIIQQSQTLAEDGFNKIKSLQDSIIRVQNSSSKISNIINTINDIAFQTNLLALNAAVEAARAGEHGLGFAVVSEEVKSLASNSAKEAQEISDIISETVSDIKNGTKEAEQTRVVFEDIVNGINKTTTIVNGIKESYIQEENSLNSFVSVVKNIEDNSQKLSSSSEETAASAEELTAQAHRTMEVVDDISTMVRG
jgi:predicted PurR-regulated permease PerM